jgi:hypothetical protein
MIAGVVAQTLLGLVKKHGVALGLVLIIVVQGYISQINTNRLERQIAEGLRREEEYKAALARANQAIAVLDERAKTLPPGKTETVFIKVPEYIGYEKPMPVLVTRTERAVETKIETITLPAEKIKEIIDRSPQSLVFEIEATRDIVKGEKFRIIASQIQPGFWQPILDIGAPIKVDAKVVTPIDKIPQPQIVALERRFHVTGLVGHSFNLGPFLAARINYALNQTFGLEAQAAWYPNNAIRYDGYVALTARW